MSTTETPDPRRADDQPTDRLDAADATTTAPEPVVSAPAPAGSTRRNRVLTIVAIAVGGLLALGLAFGGGFATGSFASRFGGPGTAGGPGPGFDRPDGMGPGLGDRDGSRGDSDGPEDTEN